MQLRDTHGDSAAPLGSRSDAHLVKTSAAFKDEMRAVEAAELLSSVAAEAAHDDDGAAPSA